MRDELPEFMALDARERQEVIDKAKAVLEDVHPENAKALRVLIRSAEHVHEDWLEIDGEIDALVFFAPAVVNR